ncbi:MAG TPA: PQQ-dependent sugar dehydrogenase [Geminicoccaceae bacterium]|nr:PQQ-dependent sugar dehydrogenase [Geminicoccaceae bacterium]
MTGRRAARLAAGLASVSLLACSSAALSRDEIEARLAELNLPDGFAIDVYARVPGARQIAVAPDGSRVYVSNRGGSVYAVTDEDGDGRADDVAVLRGGLHRPSGLAVDEDGTLYVAEQNRVLRFPAGGGEPEVVLPEGTIPDASHHGTREMGIGPDGRIYVAIGVPCNICMPEGITDAIIRLDRDGTNVETYARGVRNSVGLDWHPETGELFFTDNGGDNIGNEIPPDELNRAPEPGLHFGYPYVWGDGEPYPQFEGREPPRETTPPAVPFDAHAAALGIHFYEGGMFPEAYRHDAFVAQHGSWNRQPPIGYRVVRVRFDDGGNPEGTEVFADGWLRADGRAWGRPVDVAELPDGSLLVADDGAGVVYRISYGG